MSVVSGLSHNTTVPTSTPELAQSVSSDIIRQFTSDTFSPPQRSLRSRDMDNNSLSQSMDSVNTAVSVTGEEEVRERGISCFFFDRNISREFLRIFFCQALCCSHHLTNSISA